MPLRDVKVKALIKISEALSSSLNLERGLKSILKILSDLLAMKRGTITLVDPVTNELRIEVAQGLTRKEMGRGHYKIGEGVTGKVVQTGEPMVVPDIKSEPLFLDRTKARKDLSERNYAFLCVPIKAGNRTIGSLSADHLFKGDIPYEEDIKLLTIIAAMVGQAVRVRDLAEKDKQAAVTEIIKLRRELKGKYKFENLVYDSHAMEAVLESVSQVADTNATVLLRGESGTGKELVASTIHYTSSRSDKPFVKVACAALPETLLESELFGYEKGAFTGAVERRVGRFELADKGTIFLDEIGDLSMATQVKLLRVLQEKEFQRLGSTETIKVDVRVVCATHRDLEDMVKKEKFRQDLFYRINVFPIYLPPLRERKEGIPLLADFFIEKYSKANKKRVKGINRAALDTLLAYDFPGNIRELENIIERAVILCRKEIITPDDLPLNLEVKHFEVSAQETRLPQIIESVERQKIEEALRHHKTQRKAAKALGITERMLGYKIRKYNI